LLLIPVTPYLPRAVSLAALVAAVVVVPDHGLRWLLELPALRVIGALSYAAYLLHVTMLGLVRRALPELSDQAWLVFGLGLPLTLLASAAAHLTIERPLARLRSRWR
jgi:peptidoglycan/LPS O-acetylase OafA/YrhL